MLVLVPGPLGGLQLFERRGAGRLRPGPLLHELQPVLARIRAAPDPSVVLCGERHLASIIEAVRGRADVFVVPLAWLRSIPPDRVEERARVAARLVTAHRRRPIVRVYAWDQLRLPF